MYEVRSKLFRTGAVIYTAGDCAQRICPNRQNCELRVLLRSFVATAWKRAKTLPPSLARTDLAALPWQRPVSHFRAHPPVSGEKQNSCYPPPTVLPWFGTLWFLPISKTEIEAEMTLFWYHWGDPDRIAKSAWHSDRKGLPRRVPKMEETMEPVSTCGR